MSGSDLFDKALDHHAAGRIAEAEAVCRQIIALEPKHSGALLLLGMCRAQSEDLGGAIALISRSISIEPEVPLAHLYAGLVLAQLGRIDDALRAYGQAARLDSCFFEAHYNLACLLLTVNRYQEAITALEPALKLMPDFVDAWCARAAALSGLNRKSEALADLDRVVARQHDYVPALNMRSDLYCELGRYDEALADSARSLQINPRQAQPHISRCTVFLATQRLEQAQGEIDSALAHDSNSAVAHGMRGAVHREFGRLAQSLADCDRAVSLSPNDAMMQINRGDTLLLMGLYEQALEAFDRAQAINPHIVKLYASRAVALRHLKYFDRALADCDRALELDPGQGKVAGERFLVAGLLCDWRDRAARAGDLVRRIEQGQSVSPWVVATSIDDPALQLMTARRAAIPAVALSPRTPPHERLRIAYLSPDLYAHPSAHLMVELIERHDRSRFETFGISLDNGPRTTLRERMDQAFEHCADVGDLSDSQVAAMLKEKQIDIAIDLAGHAGGGRPSILAMRPVPIVVNYAGHPGTMGADWADYILADSVIIPPGGEGYFSESIVRLPNCYLASDMRHDVAPRPSRTDQGLSESGFVFCSFNNSYKFTPETFDIWMRLLGEVEGSVLWLLVENSATGRNIRASAEARGIDPVRIVFAGRVPRAEHLARLGLADLFLDTLPCNAHTTASDALRMGVPVLTCMGRSFAARVAGSMLNAIGMDELIARDLAEYEAMALDLARSPERLAALRGKLERNRTTEPLFDMARLARHVESAYETMWRRHSEGLPPAGFNVPA